jgi:hypothetical protein
MGDTSRQPRFTLGDLTRKAGEYWPSKAAEVAKATEPDPNSWLNVQKLTGTGAQAAPAGNPFASAPTQGAQPDVQTNMGPSNPLARSEGLPLPRGNPTQPLGARATMANEASRAGAPENAIRGLNMAVYDESKFNPFSREADQPKFGGEAHYAPGLFQEGGDEWNNYRGTVSLWFKTRLSTKDTKEHEEKKSV